MTLPDVGNQVGLENPALHIFAMATRNTTATAAPVPAGQTWTGGWASPTQGSYNIEAGANFQNMTFRAAIKPSISGNNVRIKLDNSLSYGLIVIGHATLAQDSAPQSVLPTGQIHDLTFGGGAGVTLPIGGMAFSDPLPFTVTAGQYLLVSFTVTNSFPYLPQHSWASGAIQWITAVSAGDHAADTTSTAFTGSGTRAGQFTDVVTELDVATNGIPTQAVVGDGLIDVGQPNTNPNGLGTRLPDVLAAAEPTAPFPYGTAAVGVHSNQILQDFPEATGSTEVGGPSALSRIDRDLLAMPGLTTAVLEEGLDDVLNGASADDLDSNGYAQLLAYLQASNVTTVITGLTPCGGYAGDGATGLSTNDPCTAAVDDNRTTVNGWLGSNPLGFGPWSSPALFYVDADTAIGVPDQATGQFGLDPNAARTDRVNLSDAGYAALASAYLGPLDTWRLDDSIANPSATEASDTASNDTNPMLLPGGTGRNPATLVGAVTWIADPNHGPVLSLDGASGGASTANSVLNTASSYSVSAWVSLASTANTAVVAAQEGSNTPAFALEYSASTGSWAVVSSASDSTSPPTIYTVHATGAPTLNAWTHLVAAYNATTSSLSLYINGTLAGTVIRPTPWNAGGTFDLGHIRSGGWFPGLLSDVQAWNYALTSTQIAALSQEIQ